MYQKTITVVLKIILQTFFFYFSDTKCFFEVNILWQEMNRALNKYASCKFSSYENLAYIPNIWTHFHFDVPWVKNVSIYMCKVKDELEETPCD